MKLEKETPFLIHAKKLVPRMFFSPLIPLGWEDERLWERACEDGRRCEENGCKGAAYVECNAVECHLLARHVSVPYLEEMVCICRISISFWAFSWTLLPVIV